MADLAFFIVGGVSQSQTTNIAKRSSLLHRSFILQILQKVSFVYFYWQTQIWTNLSLQAEEYK